ncbi:MAG: phosphotransferase [Gammaproteobacteria bacterium]
MMTADEIIEHLARRLPSFSPTASPQKLPDGYLSYVWRVRGWPHPVIVKVAPPHVATNPELPLDPGRILFEARSLRVLGAGGDLSYICSEAVRPPACLDFDVEAHALVMEDVGDLPDLGEALRQGADGPALGTALGRFIGALHATSLNDEQLARKFNNLAMQRARFEVQYQAVGEFCRKADVAQADEIARRATGLGERLLGPGICLIMGDLWPPSILVGGDSLRIIDWELAHFGNPAQDLGHLAAHLWMQAQRASTDAAAANARSLWHSFLGAYVAAVGPLRGTLVAPGVIADSEIHCGAEILMRTVGPFHRGYLYDGLPSAAPDFQDALTSARQHILGHRRTCFAAIRSGEFSARRSTASVADPG